MHSRTWSVHCCALDRTCRKYGGPWRLAVATPWWWLAVALTPGARFVKSSGEAQWLSFRRWHDSP